MADPAAVLKKHGERIFSNEEDIEKLKEDEQDIQIRLAKGDERFLSMKEDIKEIREKQDTMLVAQGEMKGGIDKIQDILLKRNGHETPSPTTPSPPGTARSNGKIIPMPEPGTKAYWLVLILYWGGVPGVLGLTLIGAIWVINRVGIL